MTVQSSSATRRTLEVPIEALPRVYWAIVATSKLTEPEWNELCTERLEGECLLCGMKVSGAELRELAVSDPQVPSENPKLERLRLKYCARNSCESRFYRVHIQPDSELHWTGIKAQLLHTTPEVREAKTRKPRITLSITRRGKLFSVFGLFAVVILFFVLRYWIYGYHIPIIHKPTRYQVNPPAE